MLTLFQWTVEPSHFWFGCTLFLVFNNVMHIHDNVAKWNYWCLKPIDDDIMIIKSTFVTTVIMVTAKSVNSRVCLF